MDMEFSMHHGQTNKCMLICTLGRGWSIRKLRLYYGLPWRGGCQENPTGAWAQPRLFFLHGLQDNGFLQDLTSFNCERAFGVIGFLPIVPGNAIKVILTGLQV